MSKAPETLYNISLKHLAPDGKKAAVDLPAAELSHISGKQLRALLESVAGIAPGVVFPVEPELRVTTPDGKFVIHAKGGKLSLVSWSSRIKSGEYSAARIHAIITGAEMTETTRSQEGGGSGSDWMSGKAGIAMFIVAIIAINSFTVWFVTRPKKSLVPPYTLLPAGPAERLLADVAGAYQTGTAAGDHHIEIDKKGIVQRYKISRSLKPIVPQTFTVAPAESGGKPALVVSPRKTLITVTDPLTVVLYGDQYKRVTN